MRIAAELALESAFVVAATLDLNRLHPLDRLVSVADMGMLLEGFQFHPKVSVSEGEFVIRLPELGLIAAGASYEAALDELVELAEQQAQDYLDRLDFYMQTDRRGQLGWLLKFALAPSEERRSLFSPSAPAAGAQPAQLA